MKWNEYYLLLAIVVVFLIIIGATIYRNEKFESVVRSDPCECPFDPEEEPEKCNDFGGWCGDCSIEDLCCQKCEGDCGAKCDENDE